MIIKSSATLRVMSDSISAAEMTEILGVMPDKSFEKGDLVSPKSSKPIYRKAAMWQRESRIGETKSLNEHLMDIHDFLKKREKKLALLIGCQMDVFCGVFSDSEQIGFDIDHQVVEALANYPIDLVFDAYGQSAD